MPSIARILDANGNRAREALRVMEDAARFILNDAPVSGELKQLRHDLSQALSRFDHLDLNRDTPGDVGVAISAKSELTRASAAAVVIAAGKRLSESLRTIEEFGKTMDADFAAYIEKLRYRGYDLESRLNRVMASGLARQWRLCVIISEELCPNGDWYAVARAVADAGADCIQLREKGLDDAELLRRGKMLVQMTGPETTVIMNDRPGIALLSGADGVHVGQGDLSVKDIRKLVGGQLLVGVSTSNIAEAQQALRDGADYCGVGPMFPTTTKHKDIIVGPDYLREYLAWGQLPHLAIGGITPDNIDRLIDAGVCGAAVSAAVCAADDPGAVVQELLEGLRQDPASAAPGRHQSSV